MSRFFSTATDPLLACPCGCAGAVDEAFLLLLDQLRLDVGEPLTISSGYRCETYNNRISKTGKTGPHVHGKAVDIQCTSSPLRSKIIAAAHNQHITRIGIAKTFIHIDICDDFTGHPENVVWVY